VPQHRTCDLLAKIINSSIHPEPRLDLILRDELVSTLRPRPLFRLSIMGFSHLSIDAVDGMHAANAKKES